jgi:hypothetical protein
VADPTGTSSGDVACGSDASSATGALRGFLTAVSDEDKGRAEAYLLQGNRVDDDMFIALRERLVNEDVENLRMIEDQMGEGHSITVMDGSGGLLGQFEVLGPTEGCFAVGWGIYPEDSTSDASIPADA